MLFIIACFDWKIGVCQQTVVMAYYILNKKKVKLKMEKKNIQF